MLKVYEVIEKKLTLTNTIKKRSWIDLINPTSEEIKNVIENTGIENSIRVSQKSAEQSCTQLTSSPTEPASSERTLNKYLQFLLSRDSHNGSIIQEFLL